MPVPSWNGWKTLADVRDNRIKELLNDSCTGKVFEGKVGEIVNKISVV